MTSVRLAYVFVAIFAATLYSSAVAVSAITNSDTALIGNTDTGLHSGVQRRLRGTVKEDLANEERVAPISGTESGVMAALEKFASGFSANGLAGIQQKIRFNERMKALFAWAKKTPDGFKKLRMMLTKFKPKKTGAATQNVEKESVLNKETSFTKKEAKNEVETTKLDHGKVSTPEKESALNKETSLTEKEAKNAPKTETKSDEVPPKLDNGEVSTPQNPEKTTAVLQNAES